MCRFVYIIITYSITDSIDNIIDLQLITIDLYYMLHLYLYVCL